MPTIPKTKILILPSLSRGNSWKRMGSRLVMWWKWRCERGKLSLQRPELSSGLLFYLEIKSIYVVPYESFLKPILQKIRGVFNVGIKNILKASFRIYVFDFQEKCITSSIVDGN